MTFQRLLYWLFTSLFIGVVLGGMVGVFAGALVGWIVGILAAGSSMFYMCSEENKPPPVRMMTWKEFQEAKKEEWESRLGRFS